MVIIGYKEGIVVLWLEAILDISLHFIECRMILLYPMGVQYDDYMRDSELDMACSRSCEGSRA